jgi:hypothetical protein
MGAAWPYRCTGMMARVRGVRADSTLAGSSSSASSSTSAKTIFAPARRTASAVAMKVFAGTTTSSPCPIPSARRATSSASVPLAAPTTWRAPRKSA